jgi:hypothetical protein
MAASDEKKVKVRLNIEMSGYVDIEMAEDSWKELDELLDDGDVDLQELPEGVTINWNEAVNLLDGEVTEGEIVKEDRRDAAPSAVGPDDEDGEDEE